MLSAARRPDRHLQLSKWLQTQKESELYLSVITLGEIARGIQQQRRANPTFAADLSAWLVRTEELFEDRILPFTAKDAMIWGRLSADIGHAGADLMIAASALAHQATVVTRNVSDFQPTGVGLLDPFVD